MFTGIVEEQGDVVAVTPGADSAVLRLRGPRVVADATAGASIAVAGVCLTVVDHDDETFTVDVMAETLRRTSLGDLTVGAPVNLERAMRADGRFGGHIVQGHVDGTGTVVGRHSGQAWEMVTITLPERLAPYVVEKGSITVDGVSLTVASLGAETFTVSLIPTTLRETTLGVTDVGARVNLEVDVLAKYAERLLAAHLPHARTAPHAPHAAHDVPGPTPAAPEEWEVTR